MSNDPRNLWGILDNYLPKLETANVSTTTRQALRREAPAPPANNSKP